MALVYLMLTKTVILDVINKQVLVMHIMIMVMYGEMGKKHYKKDGCKPGDEVELIYKYPQLWIKINNGSETQIMYGVQDKKYKFTLTFHSYTYTIKSCNAVNINNNDKKLEKDRKEKEALQKRLKEKEEKLQKQEKEFVKSKMKKYNDEIVNELVKMGVGSRDECIAASYMVNPNDINEVTNKIYDLQNKQTGLLSYSMENDEKVSETSIASFENQIFQLLNIIKGHFNFMNKQEQTVNAMIYNSGQQRTKLQNAKTKSVETEKNLLNQITEISAINNFLTDIILIENLFNSEYNNEQKLKQENSRNKYTKTIPIYEQKPKPICNITSFVDLLFQAYTDITAFKQWLKSLQNECGKQNIKMISKPEAKQKNIERAFYKTFYVYAIQYPNNAHQRLTDVLRCSLVFEEFDDLYKCFAIIEKLSEKDGGILRCKDRFNLETIPFGYRDLLININCPASKGQVVCEV
eukprot:234207_1